MGADLHVTSAVLDELIAAFSGFSGQMAHAGHDIRAGDSEVTGADPLAGRVHGFAGSWHYGLSQLGQHVRDCAGCSARSVRRSTAWIMNCPASLRVVRARADASA